MTHNPCTCTFLRHPMPHERPQMEFQKVVMEHLARTTSDWQERQRAKLEATVLYLLLHTECVSAEAPKEIKAS